MVQFILNHPALLLWAFSFVLTSSVVALGKAEKAALARLFVLGDAADQEAIRTIAGAVVKWAEKKAAPNADGSSKFAVVDKMLARALPFLSADQRREIIEKAVAEMDKDANDALAAAQKTPPVA